MSPTQREKSSVLSSISRMAKEHHQSVNAAHSTLYGGSRQSSVSSTASQQAHQHPNASNLSQTSTRSSTSTARPDHDSSRQVDKDTRAVDAYSINSDMTLTATTSSSGGKTKKQLSKGWDWVKERAKEHHRSTNAAYQSYYGMGSPRK